MLIMHFKMDTNMKYRLALLLLCSFLFPLLMHAQWVRLNGPAGGTATALSIDRNDIYATVQQRCYVSTDTGHTWKPDVALPGSVYSLAIGKDATKFIIHSGQPDCVWRYAQDAEDWECVFDSSDMEIKSEKIKCVGASSNVVIVGTDFNVYYSIDQGNTWEKSDIDFWEPAQKLIHADDNLWFLSNGFRIYRSTNNGASWELVFQNVHGIVDISWSGTRLFAIYKAGVRVVYTTDAGQTWKNIYTPDAVQINTAYQNFHISSFLDTLVIYCSSGCSHGGIRTSITPNFGQDWIYLPNSPQWDGIQALVRLNEHTIAGTSNMGIARAVTTQAYLTPSNVGTAEGRSRQIVIFKDEFWAVTPIGVWQSKDKGNNWNLVFPAFSYCSGEKVLYEHYNYLFYLDPHQHVLYRYRGDNAPWEAIDTVSDFTYTLLANEQYLLRYRSNYVKFSEDGGQSWKERHFTDLDIKSIRLQKNKWFVTSNNDNLLRISEDEGETWQLYSNLFIDVGNISLLKEDGHFLVQQGFLGRLAEWNIASDSIDYFFPIHLTSGDTIYLNEAHVIYHNGIYWTYSYSTNSILFSLDGCRTWQSYASPDVPYINDFVIEGTDFLAATSDGIWKNTLPITLENDSNQITLKIWPNPSSNHVLLSCNQIINQAAQISIFNVEGRLIKEQNLPAGQTWDVPIQDLSQGVYYIRLQTDRREERVYAMTKLIKI
jgi:photosystem II stability/assembly factor-like uncharacterized protein